jgi:type IV secretion system protein VirB9
MKGLTRRGGPWVCAVLALCVAASAKAAFFPVPGKLDARIRTVIYERDQVYRLYGFVGYALDLVFGAHERFEGLSAGDPKALIYSAHGNVLTLRPRALSVHTNLTVTTDRHRYYFEYSATDRAPHDGVHVMYAVRFIYPQRRAQDRRPTAAERVKKALKRAEQVPPVNRNYWYCGSPALRPVAASDNGIETRLTFGARSALPAVFVLNAEGTESLVNFSMHQGVMVIERIAHRFVLRRGTLTGYIVNKGFTATGARLASGTISPGVERVVRRVRP